MAVTWLLVFSNYTEQNETVLMSNEINALYETVR